MVRPTEMLNSEGEERGGEERRGEEMEGPGYCVQYYENG